MNEHTNTRTDERKSKNYIPVSKNAGGIIILGHNYFISEPIFKLSAALFTTFGLQKDEMVIFSSGVSEKRDFEKCSF